MQRRLVHTQSYSPIVLLVSTSCDTLASLNNGLTTPLSRLIQLQSDIQGVGVHHMSHSETGDALTPTAPTAHRVFEVPFQRLVPVFRSNTAEDVQTAKPACRIGAMHTLGTRLNANVVPAKWFQCSNKNGENKQKFEVDLPPNQAHPFMVGKNVVC